VHHRRREQSQPRHRAGRSRAVAALLTLTVAGGLFTACGEDDDGDAAGSDSTATSAPGAHSGRGNGEGSLVPEDARHVPVTARSYAFEPDEITVETGEPIAIVLTSEDALHDFVIDEVDAHVSADSGQTGIGGFHAPSDPGRYAFYCTVAGHREQGMEGTLVVEAGQ
jgi:plastocyanin